MNKKNLLVIGLVFCVASVLYLAIPALAPTSPPFDLYGAVKDIQTKVNWIWSGVQEIGPGLSSIRAILTALEQKLWSAGDSVKNDTLVINQKLVNVSKIESGSGILNIVGDSAMLDVKKSAPFKLSISVATIGLDDGEQLFVWHRTGPAGGGGFAEAFVLVGAADDFKIWNFETTTNEFTIYTPYPGDGMVVYYQYVIEYTD